MEIKKKKKKEKKHRLHTRCIVSRTAMLDWFSYILYIVLSLREGNCNSSPNNVTRIYVKINLIMSSTKNTTWRSLHGYNVIKTLHFGACVYLTENKLDGFNFSVISWFLRNPTYHRSMFIALVYVHPTHLFST